LAVVIGAIIAGTGAAIVIGATITGAVTVAGGTAAGGPTESAPAGVGRRITTGSFGSAIETAPVTSLGKTSALYINATASLGGAVVLCMVSFRYPFDATLDTQSSAWRLMPGFDADRRGKRWTRNL
jgi:hypothetical protein